MPHGWKPCSLEKGGGNEPRTVATSYHHPITNWHPTSTQLNFTKHWRAKPLASATRRRVGTATLHDYQWRAIVDWLDRKPDTLSYHLAHPAIDSSKYIQMQRLRIGEFIASRHRIYLDTKQWLQMRDGEEQRCQEPFYLCNVQITVPDTNGTVVCGVGVYVAGQVRATSAVGICGGRVTVDFLEARGRWWARTGRHPRFGVARNAVWRW